MQDRILLNNDVELPLVGLGTWNLNGDECISTVATALQNGYQLIDTAQMYGNEKEVGAGIKKSGISHENLFLTTKLYRKSNSYQLAKEGINESLKSLGVDYVDLLLLHEPYSQGPDMYRAMEEAYHEGKARAVGISNYYGKWYTDFMKSCDVIPAVNQVENHIYYQKWHFQQQMEQDSVKMQAWSPLAQGIGGVPEMKVLKIIGEKYHKTAAQVALRFLVQRGISVIPKSKHKERLLENIEIFDFSLTEDEIGQIKKCDRNDTLFPWTKAF